MKLIVAFNPSEYSVQIDEEGHVIEPHTWGVADADFVAELLQGGRLYETDTMHISDESALAAIMAKRELEERLRAAKPVPPKKSTTVVADPATASPATEQVKE